VRTQHPSAQASPAASDKCGNEQISRKHGNPITTSTSDVVDSDGNVPNLKEKSKQIHRPKWEQNFVSNEAVTCRNDVKHRFLNLGSHETESE